jgi:two-component system chemotaxis sensor kinase CheA
MIFESHKKAFIEEMIELLGDLEQTLLELEERMNDKELIAKVFRALHTVKGSAGMFGYDQMSQFTHNIENVYDYIRNGDLLISHHIIDLTLQARDQLIIMLQLDYDVHDSLNAKAQEIVTAFGDLIKQFKGEDSAPKLQTVPMHEAPAPVTLEANAQLQTYLIHFRPPRDIFKNGTNPTALLDELSKLGSALIIPSVDEVPILEFLDAEDFFISWDILLQTNQGRDAIADIFIFVDDGHTIEIKEYHTPVAPLKDSDFNELQSIIEQKAPESCHNFEELLQMAFSELEPVVSVQDKIIPVNAIRKEMQDKQHGPDTVTSLRVSTEKLDELVNLVSELVTIQARLGQIASMSGDTTVVMISEEVERITWALRDSALNIRMLPIGTTFSKFKRLVRDLSHSLGKEVDLATLGAETELDKTVIEKLSDPLIHIIRNSIDHGIESPEERVKAGKPAAGTIHLSASQSGGTVLISIRDDGAGINKESVRRKAIVTGLINENQEVTDTELYALLFAPGFSTAKSVTNVSGRGVGMDVVKRAIESLRGSVSIESKEHIGTTVLLKLPLTLAIIDGLLVCIDSEKFVLPLSSVEECVELLQQDIERAHGRNIINIRGEIIPYINLRRRFSLNQSIPEIQQVVIAGIDGVRVGFLVDKVIGQHQTVLKTLGRAYKNLEGISGATILGDGSVALILDIAKLAEREVIEESI